MPRREIGRDPGAWWRPRLRSRIPSRGPLPLRRGARSAPGSSGTSWTRAGPVRLPASGSMCGRRRSGKTSPGGGRPMVTSTMCSGRGPWAACGR
ncbi:hypothetical protein STH2373 [Symbiobacterium thermophilum IAM 14863]|uniref:Uncharacterized protein n=1 Tax=Symbiobacterium thermophilum (strain DSM 24528 / JCM 14929 / IAM 14863 / T) TaxID=292459 RepID=Q67LT8_SYMTH|nr:hypothetical protein STH2373 [Symbiobacterium thermophilum IAM 14863]